jgi:hypothetical protein
MGATSASAYEMQLAGDMQRCRVLDADLFVYVAYSEK